MRYHIDTDDLVRVLGCQSVDELVTCMAKISQRLGFEYFVYGSQRDGETTVVSGYPQSWQRAYQEHGYIRVDPTVRHAMQSCLPLVWHPGVFSDPMSSQMYEDARAHGVRSGLSLSMHGHGSQRTMISFASDLPMSPEREAHAESVMAEALLVMSYVHEAVRTLLPQPGAPAPALVRAEPPTPVPAGAAAPPLTPRELECLRWAMAGKSSWETGQIIACSERTVNFHIGNALRKLDVPNRRSAVVRALALHLIEP
jgi:LuxR family transcriptional regulator, quorum-sensing system regulator LasR